MINGRIVHKCALALINCFKKKPFMETETMNLPGYQKDPYYEYGVLTAILNDNKSKEIIT